MNDFVKVSYGIHSDIDSWMELVRKVRWNFPGLETEEAIKEHRQTVLEFIRKYQAFCVKKEGNVIGVLLFSIEHNMICFLAVAPEYRKNGIASAMLEKAISVGQDKRHHSVHLPGRG